MNHRRVKKLKRIYLESLKFINEKHCAKYWRNFKRAYKEGRLNKLGESLQ